jgi:Methyltransferase domain
MLPHWNPVIEPFLRAIDAGPIIEVGAETGKTTIELAKLCRERGHVLHSIDPFPQFDVACLELDFAEHFCFHRERSLDALRRIEPAGAVVLDGDHNWYTVFNELTALEEIAGPTGRFPVVMLHDVEWPYARRDMYYAPDVIPDDHRKPWARRGIRWQESRLAEDGGGFNEHLANAIEEGGPQNGVLTAVEDFIRNSALPVKMRIVRGDAGIAVLVSEEVLDANSAVRRQWERLHSLEFLLKEAERLSTQATEYAARWFEAARNTGATAKHEL